MTNYITHAVNDKLGVHGVEGGRHLVVVGDDQVQRAKVADQFISLSVTQTRVDGAIHHLRRNINNNFFFFFLKEFNGS